MRIGKETRVEQNLKIRANIEEVLANASRRCP
jgi:hypothetical protein